VFNKIVGDSDFELEFADFLEGAEDVISFAKNYPESEIHFKIDYKMQMEQFQTIIPTFLLRLTTKQYIS
jgi:type III restriction enzyme